tara:strand:+ start:1559 stop:1972 length:414 start_codon:yes stop_codon:yes gene_type:complete
MKLTLGVITTAMSMMMLQPALAVTLPAVPLEPIYFEPPVIERNSEVEQLSCVGLDNTIRKMQPYRYSYKEPFYEDDANKIAAAMVTVDFIPIVQGLAGLAYMGYSATVEEKEQRRILLVEQRIALLQQLKAEKRCFE